MRYLSLVLVGQLILALIIVNSSPLSVQQTKKQVSQVLGIRKLAQSDSTPAPEVSPDPSPTPEESSSPSPDASPIDNSTALPTPGESPSLLDQTTGTNPASPEQPTSPVSDQTQSVLDPDIAMSNPDNIGNQILQISKSQDQQLAQTTDPLAQSNLLVNFATDDIKQIENSIRQDNFASTNFISQRLNDKLDQSLANLPRLSAGQSSLAKQQLTDFCNQADLILRSAVLSVPEGSEQDLAINRGRCLSLSP